MRAHTLQQFITFLAVGLAGCGNGDGASDSLSRVTDSAGVSIVTGPEADVPLPWTFTEVVTVGGDDEGPGSFTSANWWTVATDGARHFAVLDREDSKIHVFDASGVHVRTVGARGGGPGELQFPSSLSMQADGSVSVFDFAKRALVRWSGNGDVLPEIRWDEARGFPNGRSTALGDTVAFQVSGTDTLQQVSSIRLMTPLDTMDVDSVVSPRGKMIMFACVGLQLAPLFEGELQWALGDGRIATTTQSQYVITVREGNRITRSVRRSVTPPAATTADAERLYPTGMEVGFGNGRKCVTPAAEVAEKAGIAKTIPLVKAMRFGPDGTLWVERYTFKDETPSVDVFDHAGRYLGTITGRPLPLGFLGADIALFPVDDAATGGSAVGVFRIARDS